MDCFYLVPKDSNLLRRSYHSNWWFIQYIPCEDLCARRRYQGQGQVITTFKYCGIQFLPPPPSIPHIVYSFFMRCYLYDQWLYDQLLMDFIRFIRPCRIIQGCFMGNGAILRLYPLSVIHLWKIGVNSIVTKPKQTWQGPFKPHTFSAEKTSIRTINTSVQFNGKSATDVRCLLLVKAMWYTYGQQNDLVATRLRGETHSS